MTGSDYVVFPLDSLKEMFVTIYTNVGTIFTVAMYAFILVIGVYKVLDLIRAYAQ